MRLVLFGMQGSGKGTQAKMLAERYHWSHISTGDVFRYNIKNQTVLGKEVKKYLDSGALVPDALTISVLEDEVRKKNNGKGLPEADFILDGFPRTLAQAEALSKLTDIDLVIELRITEKEAVKRLSSRRSCEKCGAVFNVATRPPKVDGRCDKCSGNVIQRNDDRPEAIKKRISIYNAEFIPLMGFYKKSSIFVHVDGSEPIQGIFEKLKGIIDKHLQQG